VEERGEVRWCARLQWQCAAQGQHKTGETQHNTHTHLTLKGVLLLFRHLCHALQHHSYDSMHYLRNKLNPLPSTSSLSFPHLSLPHTQGGSNHTLAAKEKSSPKDEAVFQVRLRLSHSVPVPVPSASLIMTATVLL
jgi:hypothetical protein